MISQERIDFVIGQIQRGESGGRTITKELDFDIENPADRELLFEKIGERIIYIVAKTNSTEIPFNYKFDKVNGLGFWKDGNTIYIDEIMVLDLPGLPENTVRIIAKHYQQKCYLKIDGARKTYEFIQV